MRYRHCGNTFDLQKIRTEIRDPFFFGVRSGSLCFASSLLGHDRVCHFGCLKPGSNSVQVLFNGVEAVMVLALMILK